MIYRNFQAKENARRAFLQKVKQCISNGNVELLTIDELSSRSSIAEKIACIRNTINLIVTSYKRSIGKLWQLTQPKLEYQLKKLRGCQQSSNSSACVADVVQDVKEILEKFGADVQVVRI